MLLKSQAKHTVMTMLVDMEVEHLGLIAGKLGIKVHVIMSRIVSVLKIAGMLQINLIVVLGILTMLVVVIQVGVQKI